MKFSYIRKRTGYALLEGFEFLGDEFMVYAPSGDHRLLLDGLVRKESSNTYYIKITINKGEKRVYDAFFLLLIESYDLYDQPFFLIYGTCYGVLPE